MHNSDAFAAKLKLSQKKSPPAQNVQPQDGQNGMSSLSLSKLNPDLLCPANSIDFERRH